MNIQQLSERLINLIEEGNIQNIKEIISSGYDINNEIEEGITPLIVAANSGNLEVVKVLVELGANVNQICDDGTTPLSCAIDSGNINLLNYISPLVSLEIKKILLLNYIFDEQSEVVELLIQTGIDVDACREKGMTHENGRTALILAISEQYLEIVKILIRAGASPNLCDEDSSDSPLIYAVRKQNIEIVSLLLQSGANTSYKNFRGETAFSIAQALNNSKIIAALQDIA
jgi:uncharacterized protein